MLRNEPSAADLIPAMDFFDLFPIVPPSMPGERGARDPLESVAAGVATVLLPIVNAILVLATGLKGHAEIALIAMPLLSAAIAYLAARWLSTSAGRSLLLGFGCTVACFMGNVCALVLAAIGNFYSTF
jgi:hypothetical protein